MTQVQHYQILLKNGATYKVLILDHPLTESGLAKYLCKINCIF